MDKVNVKLGARKEDKETINNEMAKYVRKVYDESFDDNITSAIAQKHVRDIYSKKYHWQFLGMYSENYASLIGFSVFKISKGELDIHDIIICDQEEYLDFIQKNIFESFISVLENYAEISKCTDMYFEVLPQNEILMNLCAEMGYEIMPDGNSKEDFTVLHHKTTPKEPTVPRSRKLVP